MVRLGDSSTIATPEHKQNNANTAMQNIAAGAIAGSISRTLLAPIDRVKILYQINTERRFGFSNAWKTSKVIFRDESIAGFYRGNGISIVRVAPYAATIFSTFTFYEKILQQTTSHDHDNLIRFCAGSLAGMTAVTLTYPLDMLRTRIAAEWFNPSTINAQQSALRRAVVSALQKRGVSGL